MSDPQWWLLDDLVLARSTIDRAAALRRDTDWVARARVDPSSRFLHVHDGAALLSHDSLVLTGPVEPEVPTTLLGVGESGEAFFCAHHASPDSDLAADASWRDLRTSASALDAQDAGLMVAAVALDNWSRAHRHCSKCGGTLSWQDAGWSRRCATDGTAQFPRTDPAVIVLVRDEYDRALLGRQTLWEPSWFSTLAGFVEAGESAEAAVRREVAEESGVRIGDASGDLVYFGSQPWPFPSSLMLGYHAWAADTNVQVDGEEIAEARWFSRAELADACATGKVSLPPDVSIARKLIERWFGDRLPGAWSRPLSRSPRAESR